MCLTIPGRVVRITPSPDGPATAEVDFEGSRRPASLIFLPEVAVGEYVLVQAGIAIARVPREEAELALEIARRPLDVAAPEHLR